MKTIQSLKTSAANESNYAKLRRLIIVELLSRACTLEKGCLSTRHPLMFADCRRSLLDDFGHDGGAAVGGAGVVGAGGGHQRENHHGQ